MLLKNLINGINRAFRVIITVVTRPVIVMARQLRRLTNLTRYISKLPKAIGALPNAFRRPEKRSDFVDAGKVYMAKRTIILIVVLVVAVPLLFYFFLWPYVQPLWFTARFTYGDPRLDNYSGKVIIYYDDGRAKPMFEGRLLEGRYTDRGVLYFENGFVMYQGTFAEGAYDDFGRLYAEDAMLIYEGGYKMGQYDGSGTLYSGYDTVLYNGSFEDGVYHGTGDLYDADGNLIYSGGFDGGEYSGKGRLYDNGVLLYNGEFMAGRMHGWGDLSATPDAPAYTGEFRFGEKSGFGTEYYENGAIFYTGSFSAGVYNGLGLLNMSGGYSYEGMFAEGAASGNGRLLHNGFLIYAGEFNDGYAHGTGTLTHSESGVIYEGMFELGTIAPGALFTAPPTEIYDKFKSGMTQFLGETEFYLYNSTLGCALRFWYANDSRPAQLVEIFLGPSCKLPVVGEASFAVRDGSAHAGAFDEGSNESIYPGAARPDENILSLINIAFPADMFATREMRGTVSITTWRDSGGMRLLYVFEQERTDEDTLPADGGSNSQAADIEYYLMFGLTEIIPTDEG